MRRWYEFVCRYTYLFVLMWRPEVKVEFLPLLALCLETQLGWPGVSICVLPQCLDQELAAALAFTHGAGPPNLCVQACIAGTVPTETYPSPARSVN